jgi:hypothetical protein
MEGKAVSTARASAKTKCLPLFGGPIRGGVRRKTRHDLVLIVVGTPSLLFTMVRSHRLTHLMDLIIPFSSLLRNRKVGKCSASLIGG